MLDSQKVINNRKHMTILKNKIKKLQKQKGKLKDKVKELEFQVYITKETYLNY
jgi:hypothetical protein